MCNYFGRHDVHGSKDEPIRGVVSTPWTPWAMPDLTKSWSSSSRVERRTLHSHSHSTHFDRLETRFAELGKFWGECSVDV